jgi:hypothetical protein
MKPWTLKHEAAVIHMLNKTMLIPTRLMFKAASAPNGFCQTEIYQAASFTCYFIKVLSELRGENQGNEMGTRQRCSESAMFPWDDSPVSVPTQQSRALRLSLVLTKSNRNNHQRERDSGAESAVTACFIRHLLFVSCIAHNAMRATGKMLPPFCGKGDSCRPSNIADERFRKRESRAFRRPPRFLPGNAENDDNCYIIVYIYMFIYVYIYILLIILYNCYIIREYYLTNVRIIRHWIKFHMYLTSTKNCVFKSFQAGPSSPALDTFGNHRRLLGECSHSFPLFWLLTDDLLPSRITWHLLVWLSWVVNCEGCGWSAEGKILEDGK